MPRILLFIFCDFISSNPKFNKTTEYQRLHVFSDFNAISSSANFLQFCWWRERKFHLRKRPVVGRLMNFYNGVASHNK